MQSQLETDLDLCDDTLENRAAWQEWLKTRPPKVKKVAEKLDPFQKFKVKTTGQIGRIVGFSESGNKVFVRMVALSGPPRPIPYPFEVFGMSADDFELLN